MGLYLFRSILNKTQHFREIRHFLKEKKKLGMGLIRLTKITHDVSIPVSRDNVAETTISVEHRSEVFHLITP